MRRLIIGTISLIIVLLLFGYLFVSLLQQSSEIAWQPDRGLTRTIVWTMAVSNQDPAVIYAGTDSNGLYQSSDGGQSWEFNDLDPSFRPYSQGKEFDQIRDIYINPSGQIFVATWGGSVYWSETGAEDSWQQLFVPQGDFQSSFQHTRKLVAAGPNRKTVYVGTYGGVLMADPASQSLIPTALTPDSSDKCAGQSQTDDPVLGRIIPVHALLADPLDPSHLYAAIWGFGVCHSSDAGETWSRLAQAPDGQKLEANALAISPQDPGVIYLGTFGQGVYRLEPGSESWLAWNKGDLPPDADIWSLHFAADEQTLYAGTRYDGTFVLPAGGQWQKVAPLPYGALSLAVNPGSRTMLAGTWGGGIFRQSEDEQEWQSLNMPVLPLPVNAVVETDAGIFAGTGNDGVWRSLDGGQSWTRVAGDQDKGDYLEGPALVVYALVAGVDNHTLYAGTGNGFYQSANNGDTWRSLNGPTNIVSLLSLKQDQREVVLAGTRTQGLYLFDSSWHQVPGLSGDRHIKALAYFHNNIYASDLGRGLFKVGAPGRITAESLPWQPAELSPRSITSLIVVGPTTWSQRLLYGSSDQLLAITDRGVYRTEDGETWSQVQVGDFSALAVNPGHPQVSYLSSVFTSTQVASTTQLIETPLLISTNNGQSWPLIAQPQSPTPTLTSPIISLLAGGQEPHPLFAGTTGGLYKSKVTLPILWREIIALGGLILVSLTILLLMSLPYGLIARPYQIAFHRAAYLLYAKPRQLNLVWERLGQTPLSDIEQVVLLDAPPRDFEVADMWRTLDHLGAAPGMVQLHDALNNLVYRHRLLHQEGDRYQLPLLEWRQIAAQTFGRRVEQTKKRIRHEHSIYRDIEQFFVLAGFETYNLETEYLLRPETPNRIPGGDTWAWPRLGSPLTPDDITGLNHLIAQRNLAGPAFVVVSERPTPAGYLALVNRNLPEQPPLVPIDTQSMQRALVERTTNDTLDIMIHRARPGYNHFALYTPVADRLNFFGRERILETLYHRLTRETIPLTTVRGLPKVGLTSLLQHLQYWLEAIPCVLIDLRYEDSADTLLYNIAGGLLADVQRKYPSASLPPMIARLQAARPGQEAVRQVFRALQDMPGKQAAIKKFVILVDATGLAPDKEEILSQEIRQLTEATAPLAVVTTTNKFTATDFTLPPFSEMETEAMLLGLAAAAGIQAWPTEIIRAIYRASGGHPWLIRHLGSALSKQGQVIEPADVEETALDLVENRSAFFELLWESLPESIQAHLIEGISEETAWLDEIGLFTAGEIRMELFKKWLNLEFGLDY